jgi:hypothetical protein
VHRKNKEMEDSDQDVQEIDPPVINRTRRKKYRRKILIELLDPYFCCRNKRNAIKQPIIDLENDNTSTLSDLGTNSTTEDVGIR